MLEEYVLEMIHLIERIFQFMIKSIRRSFKKVTFGSVEIFLRFSRHQTSWKFSLHKHSVLQSLVHISSASSAAQPTNKSKYTLVSRSALQHVPVVRVIPTLLSNIT